MRGLIALFVALLVMGAAIQLDQARAQGAGPAGLADAGWDCFQPPPDFNPYIHCAPPGQLERIISGEARSAMFITFETTDLDAESAPLLGTERLIRSDLYHGQPCPTDPPTYQYSSLEPRFGWNYHICHTFDSPW
ncbi:MAG: hypothetical protein ACRDHF_13595 [Tepidiformaceae bacterium]